MLAFPNNHYIIFERGMKSTPLLCAYDINAIHILKSFMDEENAVGHAINFFMAIDLYEQVKEQISPSMGHIKTHPDSMDRIRRLLEEFPTSEFNLENLISMNNSIKNILMKYKNHIVYKLMFI